MQHAGRHFVTTAGQVVGGVGAPRPALAGRSAAVQQLCTCAHLCRASAKLSSSDGTAGCNPSPAALVNACQRLSSPQRLAWMQFSGPSSAGRRQSNGRAHTRIPRGESVPMPRTFWEEEHPRGKSRKVAKPPKQQERQPLPTDGMHCTADELCTLHRTNVRRVAAYMHHGNCEALAVDVDLAITRLGDEMCLWMQASH